MPPRSKRPRNTGPTPAVRALVYARDGHRCVRCSTGQNLTIQHRQNRAMGGSTDPRINLATNLLTACQDCNMRFEDQPAEAYAHGWKVRRPADPADVPVAYGNELRSLLPDGTYQLLGALRAPATAAAR